MEGGKEARKEAIGGITRLRVEENGRGRDGEEGEKGKTEVG